MEGPARGPELDAIVDAVVARLGVGGVPALPDREQLPDLGIHGWRFTIAGIELTQAVQHHNAAGKSYGADNSVPLVALKDLVARAYPYVSAGTFEPAPAGLRVTGELVLSRGNNVVYRTGPTRADGAPLGSRTELDRGLWDGEELHLLVPGGPGISGSLRHIVANPPLNFRVPGWYCRPGRMTATVRLWVVPASGTARSVATVASETAEFRDVGAPKVALVRVNWTDAKGVRTSPSDAEMLACTALAERMLPFPYLQPTILGIAIESSAMFSANQPVAGGCNAAWTSLVSGSNDLYWLGVLAGLFGLGTITYAMVPMTAVGTGDNGGCRIVNAAGIVAAAGAGPADLLKCEQAFAHELGHYFGCGHVNVTGATNNDPNYPNYGGSKTSIGEVGVDCGSGDPLQRPEIVSDIMSYDPPEQWISPYHYRRIFDNRSLHQAAPADPRRVRRLVGFAVRLHRDGTLELRRSFVVKAAGDHRPAEDVESPLSVDVIDRDQQIIATRHLFRERAVACGDGCGGGRVPADREPYLDMADVVEWPEGATALSFHRGGEVVAVVEAGDPPTVSITEPTREDGRLVLEVQADHGRATPSVAVLYTPDGGTTFVPVALQQGRIEVDAERLPGGARCFFRAVATAELQSAVADTAPFEAAPARHALHLRVPGGDCPVPTGPVTLTALVDRRGEGDVHPAEVRWRSSLDGDLGAGLHLVANLSAGRHELAVTAPDGAGGTLSERAIIIVGG